MTTLIIIRIVIILPSYKSNAIILQLLQLIIHTNLRDQKRYNNSNELKNNTDLITTNNDNDNNNGNNL